MHNSICILFNVHNSSNKLYSASVVANLVSVLFSSQKLAPIVSF